MELIEFLSTNQRFLRHSSTDRFWQTLAEVTWLTDNLRLHLQVAEGWLLWCISITFTYQTLHPNINNPENTHTHTHANIMTAEIKCEWWSIVSGMQRRCDLCQQRKERARPFLQEITQTHSFWTEKSREKSLLSSVKCHMWLPIQMIGLWNSDANILLVNYGTLQLTSLLKYISAIAGWKLTNLPCLLLCLETFFQIPTDTVRQMRRPHRRSWLTSIACDSGAAL